MLDIKKWSKVGLKVVIGLFFAGVFFTAGFLTSVWRSNNKVNFTSQELLQEVNGYRMSKGVAEVKADRELCNEIGDRWQSSRTNESHIGFDEWIKKHQLWEKGYTNIQEDLASGDSAEEVVESWRTSMGHEMSLVDQSVDSACTYVGRDGGSVLIMAKAPKK